MLETWRHIQLKNFTSWEKLTVFLKLPDFIQEMILKKSSFPLNLPLRLAQKIALSTLEDPILKQFLPTNLELKVDPSFSLSPVKDALFQKNESKILHKYEGRALLLVSGACAMNCRYCFRKNFSYETQRKDFSLELDLIEKDPYLKEIILSGGDPLSLSDENLKNLLNELDRIPHIKRIRFHSRFPIGIPERINDSFLEILSQLDAQVFFVLHVNHARELDSDIFLAMKKLQKIGIPVLSQSVLLKDVNDSVSSLKELFETLSDNGIIPYYLHQLDKVQGAGHFEVSEEEGKKLMKELSTCVSGYCLPKYAKEEPGKPSKTLISF